MGRVKCKSSQRGTGNEIQENINVYFNNEFVKIVYEKIRRVA